ncbi:MAG: helix-turn-helix transcriptional regulator [Cytophagales bacterium]|nr:helix-turn-helix transcriptional regulator [Armatimonadota bacterium]
MQTTNTAGEQTGDRETSSYCPATQTIKVIGGRWKLLILWHLLRDVQRYSDLQRCLPGITPKMLTQQLREMEEDGVVHREVYRQVPPKVEYSLTPLGEELRPVLHEINAWGRKYGDAHGR